MPRTIVALALAVLAGIACDARAPRADGNMAAAVPRTVGSPPALEPASAPAAETLEGTVLETLDAGGYTYLRLQTARGELWAAVNQARVEKGARVRVANPLIMRGFESKTLGRTFEVIYFGSLAGAAASPDLAAVHGKARSDAADVGPISVARAEGPQGRTVAEVFAQRAALAGKPVSVRGKVVKYNEGILGRNWIHLRDGSGSRAGADDDLTVTTTETAKVGEVVVVKGRVGVDRDFGAGYTYPVLVEEARLSR